MKNVKETKLPHLTKGLIGNYHYVLNIEQAKPVLEKGLKENRCWETYQLPLSKQREVIRSCRLPCTCIQVKFK